MKNIKTVFLLLLLIPTALWLLADSFIPQQAGFLPFRNVFMQFSGIITFTAMSVCVILAARPAVFEKYLNGLDKMYRLHKWLGITALIVSISHWWFAKGVKWMAKWGWIQIGKRPPHGPQQTIVTFQDWLSSQRHLAESVGEWAFYLALALMIIALIKAIPYRWFAKFHKILAAAYLVLAYHTLVLVKFAYWSQPIGWWTALLLICGVVSSIWILLGKIGKNRRSEGTVRAVDYSSVSHTLTVETEMPIWKGHQPGQFAFANLHNGEKPHPFTLASAWNPTNKRVILMIKTLGDYTRNLPETLKTEQKITLEGPYGQFDFHGNPQQIWISGGIGLTPFVARAQALAQTSGTNSIDWFHTASNLTEVEIGRLKNLAAAAGINLHLFNGNQQRLTGEIVRNTGANWQNSAIWLCGPTGLGRDMRRDLQTNGLKAGFHQECFEMR